MIRSETPGAHDGRRTRLRPAAVLLAAAALMAGAHAAAEAAPLDQARAQWTISEGPAKRPLDFAPFVRALDGLSAERSAVVAGVADNGNLAAIGQALRGRSFASEELVTWYLGRIRDFDAGRYQSVLELNPDALAGARESDARLAAGTARGPLEGIPVLVKGNISTGDRMHTTAGAAALGDLVADRDAFVVGELRDAGAVILGKANMSEWANEMSSRSVNGYSALGGYTRNPYGRFDVLGSSSGSAVAAAASFAAVTVGTETDGSIIAPSAANNVVGLKPTLGLVSRDRIIPISDEQDTAGPIGRSVADVAALLTVLASRRDPGDRYSAQGRSLAGHDFGADAARPARGLRLGVYDPLPGHPDARRLAKRYARTGIRIVPFGYDHIAALADRTEKAPDETRLLVIGFRFGANRYLRAVGGSGPAASLATVVAYNRQAPRARARWGQDLLVAAAADHTRERVWRRDAARARTIHRRAVRGVLAKLRVDAIADLPFAFNYAVAGLPAITVPVRTKAGAQPDGVTMVGAARSEPKLLRLAAAIERIEGLRRTPRLRTGDPTP